MPFYKITTRRVVYDTYTAINALTLDDAVDAIEREVVTPDISECDYAVIDVVDEVV